MKSEIRKDYFLNRYTIFAPARQKRPKEKEIEEEEERKDRCVFCPGGKGLEKKYLIKKYGPKKPWSIAVIKNKYPIVTLDNKNAYGEHEIVIETPIHEKRLYQFSIEEIINLIKVYRERTKEISKIKDINYILIFKNEGVKSGASLVHSHSQIFSSKIIPPDVQKEWQTAHQYEEKHGVCPYCEIIKREEKSERRVFVDKDIVAFCPYASRFHYEVWIFPRRHIDNVVQLNNKEIRSMAKVLKLVLSKLNALGLGYNFFLDQLITDKNQHFYLKIQPRATIWGGVELGSGLIVNTIFPEIAAKFYRSKN
ncbi:DUF4931 domain-containing protein [bacterium]|nr:DUF4931 domain-containing protein [bacterium]